MASMIYPRLAWMPCKAKKLSKRLNTCSNNSSSLSRSRKHHTMVHREPHLQFPKPRKRANKSRPRTWYSDPLAGKTRILNINAMSNGLWSALDLRILSCTS